MRLRNARSHQLSPLLLSLVLLIACGGGAPATNTVPPAAPSAAAAATGTVAPAATAARASSAAASGQATPGTPTSVPLAPSATVAASAGTPKRGGTVVIAISADPGAMNPAITTAGGTHNVTDQIFNGLVGLDEQLNPVPELAASWEIGEGGKVYTFKLVPNVKWHDGQPFTSADVKFTFEQALLKFHSRTKAALESVLAGIETPDPLIVVFRFKQPYGPLLQRLDVVEASIIPKHIYEGKEVDKDPANLKPIGTGPFRFVEYVKGDHVNLERNTAYFRPDRPYFDKAVYRVIPNATTATLALEQGEVDYLGSVQGSDLDRLRANKGITLVQGFGGSGGSVCQDVLIPNLTRTPFDKLPVRQAFYQAIDRQFLLDRVYFGQGGLATGPISRQLAWAYTDKVRAYPFDQAAANRALDAAGLPRGADGNRFTVTFTHAASFAKLGEALRDQLKGAGIKLELETLEVNAANDKVFVKKEFDLGVASYCNGSDPEIGVRRVYVSTNIGPVLFSNGAGYRNPEVDRLLDAAAASADRAERARLYGQMQQILTDEVPYFWLIDSRGYRAYRATYQGFRTSGGNILEAAWTTGAGR